LYAGQDRLTQTTITMQQVHIFGLDNLTDFQPLTMIGNYSLQNNLSWDFLQAEIDLLVDIQPSMCADMLIVDPNPICIQDEITVTVSLHTIELILSIFLVVNTHLLVSLLENNGKPHECPLEDWTTAKTNSAAVDFCDLLLKLEDGVALGGMGKTPYGPLAYWAYQAVLHCFTAANDKQVADGNGLDLAMLNCMLICPWTEQQLGLARWLQWKSSLMEWSQENITIGPCFILWIGSCFACMMHTLTTWIPLSTILFHCSN